MYLLDTNHCYHFLKKHASILQKIFQLGDDSLVVTCVIVQGELVYMAQKSERKEENLHELEQFLEHMAVYPVDRETADIYGRIKAAIIDHFGPKEKAKRRKATIEQLGFQENDLWIAAIAKRHGFTVVSADSDFERIKVIEELSVEKWWSP
ncbi:type II toxin-antitoxin system VapC family toxin [Candidatus Poribacteria bacterium]|nr:type II toxin-antitoxin system VapC family toxin [Candidatus Poribacteria bacterium]